MRKNLFFEKNQNGLLKKAYFLKKTANSRKFFAKITWIGPWFDRID